MFEQMMRLNYMGTVHCVKAVYNSMVARNTGHICVVSSAMGCMGFTGYAAYAASKHAVRGLADCLRNELQGTNVNISIAFPPDTTTPGYQNENLTKPAETMKISESAGAFSAKKVAHCIAAGMAKQEFMLPSPDAGLGVHLAAVQGMVPRRFPWVVVEMIIGFVSPIIHWIISGSWDRIASQHSSSRFRELRSA